MFLQQFRLYQFPNKIDPEREISNGRASSHVEPLDLLYVRHNFRVDVLPFPIATTIGTWSMFLQQFRLYQFPNKIDPEREISNGRASSHVEPLDLLYVRHNFRVDV